MGPARLALILQLALLVLACVDLSGRGSSNSRRRLMCTTMLEYYSQCQAILTFSHLVLQ
ncbi:hypothetical protein M752DRAFT_126231 [Aspergillus phoenicis ATCC 13157]|uniref:Uncharacterized protein n=1 Tax=Aspergillus phoenicis ATCC 13157 TaxID=1353007 RepID=A0A370PR96_ASPPH|nr:hypothetical protein M752DRAFT_126231 [Aspergillus phoenicis ATCC 13157]